MSSVVFFTHAHPQMPLVSNAQMQTIGSMITLFDFVLVNGGTQVNIAEIDRVGTVATVETSTAHQMIVGDKALIATTGEANFDGMRRVESVIDSTHYTFICADTGATNILATGTSKLASAGWTKFLASGNQAIYQSADLYDGEPFFIQVDDYSANHYRVRAARGMTALNTAEFITPEGYMAKGVNGNFSFCIFADNKTMVVNWAQSYSHSFGYAKKFQVEDETISPPSVYCSSAFSAVTVQLAVPSTLFGIASNFCGLMTAHQAMVYLLPTDTAFNAASLGVTTIFGMPRSQGTGGAFSTNSSPTELSVQQQSFKGVNTRTGQMPLIPVDIWEKTADTGEVLAPNSRVRGLYQAYSRVPTDYIGNQSDHILRLKMIVDGVEKNMVAYNAGSTLVLNTQLFINVDEWED